MAVSYCNLEDVKSSLAGDVPNMGTSHDQSLVNKIVEVSRDLDRQVARYRGDPDQTFSFLAEQQYGRQRVYLSSTPASASGAFVLSFAGQITSDLDHDASAGDVQAALEALSSVGAANVTVGGFDGGPYTVDFAGTLVGPQPVIEGRASFDVTDARIVVLPMIDGVLEIPSTRYFTATLDRYGKLVPIDDCVEIESVILYETGDDGGTPLSEGTDYLIYPFNGAPHQALKSTGLTWPEWPGRLAVRARWGHALAIPTDVREAATIETVRAHFAAQAGNDDRLGMTPFGKVIMSKAFTSKFKELVYDYGLKLW